MATVLRPEEGKTAGDRLELEIFGELHAFRYCPPGTFLMGSPEDEMVSIDGEEEHLDNETQHEVTLTRGFWLGETPVTQKQWTAVMGENPSYFKGDDLPVETVSWNDCQEFFEKIQESAPSCYRFDFPTEAQWEYACRAGTTTPYSFGIRCSGVECNCNGNYPYGYDHTRKRFEQVYLGMTAPVGSYPPNPWGFYDMHGNVCEWCTDWYGAYPTQSVTDPTGSSSGSYRVARGGSWYHDASFCRSAYRTCHDPTTRFNHLGFRACLVDAASPLVDAVDGG